MSYPGTRQQQADQQELTVLLAPCPPPRYYLVPSDWLARWRHYLDSSGKRGTSLAATAAAPPPRPEPAACAVQSVLCTCHQDPPLLSIKPPRVALRRNKYMQDDASKDVLTVVTETEWAELQVRRAVQVYARAQG
jgi:hypothetical protein